LLSVEAKKKNKTKRKPIGKKGGYALSSSVGLAASTTSLVEARLATIPSFVDGV
jgi:hypothetical protein